MHRLPLRLIQRVILLATSVSLFGSISVWLSLFTGFEIQPFRDVRELHDTAVDIATINHRSEGNGVQGKDKLMKIYPASVIKRAFGIEPVREASETRIDNPDKQALISIAMDSSEIHKYMFVFHHYEQFAKTTENLIQLCSLARYGLRAVVEPYVRDSRMCGLHTGWWGEALTPSRFFKPLALYFDVKTMNDILFENNYSPLRHLSEFKLECNSSNEELTIVHFLYRNGKDTTMKWFKLTDREYENILSQASVTGWTVCAFIDLGLNITTRLGEMKAGRQLCVHPEVITDYKQFENDILNGDKCVVITYWKGFGADRTHFTPKMKLVPRELVHRLRHSNLIMQEAQMFRSTFLEKSYIALHVRSERQLLWYSQKSFFRCLDAAIRRVFELKEKYNIKSVFVASDLTSSGSDTFFPKNFKIKKMYVKYMMDNLWKAKRYGAHKTDPSLMDHGVIAIVEMNILSESTHLVTLGSGSFQEWITSLFKQRKKGRNTDWTLSRICSNEKKLQPYN